MYRISFDITCKEATEQSCQVCTRECVGSLGKEEARSLIGKTYYISDDLKEVILHKLINDNEEDFWEGYPDGRIKIDICLKECVLHVIFDEQTRGVGAWFLDLFSFIKKAKG